MENGGAAVAFGPARPPSTHSGADVPSVAIRAPWAAFAPCGYGWPSGELSARVRPAYGLSERKPYGRSLYVLKGLHETPGSWEVPTRCAGMGDAVRV